jgi:hypothetical protein
MFVFGPQYTIPTVPNIHQVRVFANQYIKSKHDIRYASVSKVYSVAYADESCRGCLYKLLATKTSVGHYKATIRCGASDVLIWESRILHPTPEAALTVCMNHLLKDIRNSFSELKSRYSEIVVN